MLARVMTPSRTSKVATVSPDPFEVVTISRSGADLRWGDQVGIDRAVDGAVGAQFLKAVKQLLENPIELIL